MGVWTCPDCGADDMMGTVDHGINCPRYDGPLPEPEGFGDLEDKVDAIAEALVWLIERQETTMFTAAWLDRESILRRLKE